MMLNLFAKLWNDDQGALIATEFLFVATILIIGIVVGLSALRGAVNAELAELGNAILALNQGYSISGLTGCCASTEGSQAIDTYGTVSTPTCVPPADPSVIDVIACQ
jgi:Flp pilus assembly pilin Flp